MSDIPFTTKLYYYAECLYSISPLGYVFSPEKHRLWWRMLRQAYDAAGRDNTRVCTNLY